MKYTNNTIRINLFFIFCIVFLFVIFFAKLPMVTSLPASPSNGEAVLYIGTATGGLKTGGIYQYQVSEWVLISYAESFTFNSDDFDVDTTTSTVSLAPERRVYNGTKAVWDTLSTAEKTQYGATAFTDDEGGGSADVYSTSEVKTNKVWIDGKPIYRRVAVDVSPDSYVSISDDIETVTNIFWSATSTNYTSSECYDWGSESGSVASDVWRIKTSGANYNKFYVRGTGSIFSSGKITLVVEYTKTTD